MELRYEPGFDMEIPVPEFFLNEKFKVFTNIHV